ncbi:GNAT family N-acetyltransferase [Sphingopyxis sp. MWB1]|uniref:GNAT family N-acetyltransferase n=1 Tax=Sphingopyxis sp. MWB1 TaxID=1537715 RepID=UPI00051A4F03|nr:GNAT family N-acetyltransferase [Sphingopyxis sp. MWB1]
MDDYIAAFETPSVADYCRLRAEAGLTPRSETAAAAGLPHTIVGVVVRHQGRAVAMGRAVGDGLFYQIVDMAVEPAHQARGLGKMIMARLMARLREIAPAEAYISLIADGDAHHLYAQYGFAPTAPASIGMAQWIGRKQAGNDQARGG